jgi:hypothetical protein
MGAKMAAFCLILVSINFGCGNLSQTLGGGAAMAPSNGNLQMTAQFSVMADRLEIDYSVHNSSHTNMYLLDTAVLINSQGATTVGPAKPRVEYVQPNLAVLSDKLFPLPPGTMTAVPPSAYGELLAAGAIKRTRVEFPIPIREQSAVKAGPTQEVSCDHIRFVIGAVSDAPELHAKRQMIAGAPLWWLGPAAWNLQQELTVDAVVTPALRLLIRRP